jgi:hypothetical protein
MYAGAPVGSGGLSSEVMRQIPLFTASDKYITPSENHIPSIRVSVLDPFVNTPSPNSAKSTIPLSCPLDSSTTTIMLFSIVDMKISP